MCTSAFISGYNNNLYKTITGVTITTIFKYTDYLILLFYCQVYYSKIQTYWGLC